MLWETSGQRKEWVAKSVSRMQRGEDGDAVGGGSEEGFGDKRRQVCSLCMVSMVDAMCLLK